MIQNHACTRGALRIAPVQRPNSVLSGKQRGAIRTALYTAPHQNASDLMHLKDHFCIRSCGRCSEQRFVERFEQRPLQCKNSKAMHDKAMDNAISNQTNMQEEMLMNINEHIMTTHTQHTRK